MTLLIQKAYGKPMYLQIKEFFRKEIIEGRLVVSEKLPSLRNLAKDLNVGLNTVKRAYDDLEEEGYIQQVQGRGAYVTRQLLSQNLNKFYSFTSEMVKIGAYSKTDLLGLMVIKDVAIAKKLNIDSGDEILSMFRLRKTIDDKPFFLEKTYFDFKKYAFLKDLNWEGRSLYETLNEYHIKMDRIKERIKACLLTAEEKTLLKADDHKNFGLLIRRLAYGNDQVVCYSCVVAHSDTFEFTIQMDLK